MTVKCKKLFRSLFNELQTMIAITDVKIRIFGGIATLYCFLTMYYADITVTGQYGLVFLDSLFDGRLRSFYTNALASGVAPEGAVYDIGTYIVFGIWSIPVWIFNRLFGISPLSVGALLWFKLLPVLLLMGASLILVHIMLELGFDHQSASYGGILFLLSLSSFFPVFVAVQYDIIAVFLMLVGIKYYLIGERKKFLLFMALSMTIKPMTLLVMLLMIVAYEKDIFNIIKDSVAGASLLILCKGLYFTDQGYKNSSGSFLKKSMSVVLDATIDGSFGGVSIFVLSVVVCYMAAYLMSAFSINEGHSSNEMKKKSGQVMILLLAVWTSFCCFGKMTVYWSIYMTPFAVIAVMYAGKLSDMRQWLLIDLVANIVLTILMIFRYPWVYGGDKTYAYLVLKPFCTRVLNGEHGHMVSGILRRFITDEMDPAISAVLVGLMLVCIVYTYVMLNKCDIQKISTTLPVATHKIMCTHVILRVTMLYVWIALTIVALAVTIME